MDNQLPERLYLTGFMGSGKSTIAPLVADELGYSLYDLDAAIVERAGRSIPEIFEQSGETGFRQLEREMLETTAALDRTVVSLGGGAVTVGSNLDFVRRHGYLIYLKVPVDLLADRLYGAEGRPLLRNEHGELLSRAQLRAKISNMLAERSSFYERADCIVDAGHPSPDETAKSILSALG